MFDDIFGYRPDREILRESLITIVLEHSTRIDSLLCIALKRGYMRKPTKYMNIGIGKILDFEMSYTIRKPGKFMLKSKLLTLFKKLIKRYE